MDNLYGSLDGTKKVQSEGTSKFFPGAGIVEDVTISGLEIATAKNDSKYLKIAYTHKDGGVITTFEFAITAKNGEDAEKTIKRRDWQLARFKHILTKFYEEDKIPQVGTFEKLVSSIKSYDDLISAMVKLLPANVLATKTFRAKIVYDHKNYLSMFSFVPFLEDSAIPVGETRLQITDRDKTVRDVPKTDSNGELEASETKVSNPEDDLPF